jgi:hypothetical protein
MGHSPDLQRELEREGGPLITSGLQLPGGYEHLAPDYQLTTNAGAVWGVEVTELVSQKAIEQTKRGKNVMALWPEEELIEKFQTLVAGKDKPENVSGGPYDRYVLLVHVDECMLTTERLSAALGGLIFETRLIDGLFIGKMPTTSVRRLTSPLSRSSELVECSLVRCAAGKSI